MGYEILNVPKAPAIGLGDLTSDRAAGAAWMWAETRPYVAKFQFQDRIDVNDVNQVIVDIANRIASQSGSSNPAIANTAQAIFWNDLCPNTQREWKKESVWKDHPTYTGYRLNMETIAKAGTSVGESVNAYRTEAGRGAGGESGGGVTEPAGGGLQWPGFAGMLKSPWALLGIGAAAFGVLWLVKKRQIKGKGAR